MPLTTDVVEYCGIRCTPQNLSEWEHGRAMIVVPISEIQRIDLRHGILAPHPFLLIPFGGVIAAIGAIPLIHFLLVALQGGHFFELEIALVPFLFIGHCAAASFSTSKPPGGGSASVFTTHLRST
jgi:hypothetical protein